MGFWTRLWPGHRITTLIVNGSAAAGPVAWPAVERTIRKYYAGDDWHHFDLRFGDISANRYMIVSSRTRCADLFAVAATFDGVTFHSPHPEHGRGTYAGGAVGVYADNRCVSTATAFRAARTFCERRELDAAVRWQSFDGPGYVTAESDPALRDDAEFLRAQDLFRRLADLDPGSAEAAKLIEELRSLTGSPGEAGGGAVRGTAPDE